MSKKLINHFVHNKAQGKNKRKKKKLIFPKFSIFPPIAFNLVSTIFIDGKLIEQKLVSISKRIRVL